MCDLHLIIDIFFTYVAMSTSFFKLHLRPSVYVRALLAFNLSSIFYFILFYFYSSKVSAAKILQETCNYIKSLHREVGDLSERLSELLETTDTAQAAIIRNLLMQ